MAVLSSPLQSPLRSPLYNPLDKGGGVLPAFLSEAYFVEGWADWHGQQTGTPSGVASLPTDSEGARPLLMTVSGLAGATSLTGIAFDTTNGTGAWGAVIKHDDGTYGVYTASGITSTTITIAPPLKATVTAGQMSSIGENANGQHYTQLGYKALARHIFSRTKRQCYRRRFASRFTALTDDKSAWASIGLVAGAINMSTQNYATGANSFARSRGNRGLGFGTSTIGLGVSLTNANLGGRSGHLETFVGLITGADVRVKVTVDGVVTYNQVNPFFRRVIVPFTNANSATVEITASTATSTSPLIGDTIFWIYDKVQDWDAPLIDKNAKVVVLGDSWSVRYSNGIGTELQAAMADAGGSGTVSTVASAGQTSEWGLANFDSMVTPLAPAFVVIEFFVNDYNSFGSGAYQRWLDALEAICKKCVTIGAVPIIVMPLPTQSFGQAAGLGIWAERLGIGSQI